MQDLATVFAETNVSVRTVLDSVGDVWFSCTDVAKAVGYSDVPQVVSSLMPDRKELSEIQTPVSILGFDFQALFGKNWKATKVINLEMLNDFLMDSGKPAAKAFRKWVTGTVLPSIQKTGSYTVKPAKPKSALDLAREQVILLESIEDAHRKLARLDYFSINQLKTLHPWLVDVIHWRDLDRYAKLLDLPSCTYGTSGVHTQADTKLWHTDVLEAAAKDAARWRPHIKPETLEFNWHEMQGVRPNAMINARVKTELS